MNKLNQNILILVLIIIIIIIIIVLGFFSLSLIEVKPEPPELLENLNFSAEEPLDSETDINIRDTSPEAQEERRQDRKIQADLLDSALAANNSELCAEIGEASLKDICYNNIAINNLDISLCNAMVSETGNKRCLLEVSLTKGAQEKSVSACNNLLNPDLKQRCIEQLETSNFCLSEDCL